MTVRVPGTVSIDGVNYQLGKQKDTNAWFWHYNSSIAPPQQVTPEETILSSTQSGYKRTAGWLDWSHGGVGPSIYQPNVRWLSSSQGPITEYVRKIIQPMELQTTGTPTNIAVTALVTSTVYSITALGTTTQAGWNTAAGTSSVTYVVGSVFTCAAVTIGTGTVMDPLASTLTLDPSYGRIVDFAIGPLELNGTQLVFALQELGSARRITFTQASTSTAIKIGLATQPAAEGTRANRLAGTGQFAAGFTSGAGADYLSNGFAIATTLARITEGGPLWSFPVSLVLTPHLLVGADHITPGTATQDASFFTYSAGVGSTTPGVWRQAGTSGPDTGILRGRFQVGMYAAGPLLWASASTTAVESSASYGAGVLNLSAQQSPFTLANWTTDLFGIITSGYYGRRVGTDQTAFVNGITILRDAVLVATNDGMFYKLMTSGDLAGVPIALIDSKAAIPEADSGRTMTLWNGVVYIPTARGLFMFREFDGKEGGTLTGVGPEFIPGNQSPIRGKCVLYAGDPEYLYASFYNGTDSYVMKGRMPKDGEDIPGAMVWHAACPYIEGLEVTAITISQPKHTGKTNPVLILGCKSAASAYTLKYVILPKTGLSLLTDSLCRPSTSGSYEAILPEHDAMAPSLWKTFLRLNVVTNNFWISPPSTMGVAASLINLTTGTSYTIDQLGTSTNTAVSGSDWNVLAGTTASPVVYAVGATFIAAATGSGTGNGTVYETNAQSYNYVEVHYKIDSSDWQLLGYVTLSPLFNLPFPTGTIGYKISVKFIWNGNTTMFSYIEAVSFDFVQRVSPAKTVDVQVLANSSRLTYSGLTRAATSGRLEYLEQLKDDGETFIVIGPDGISHWAQMDQTVGISWRPTEQAHADAFPNIGYMAQFKLNIYDDFVARTPAVYDEASIPGSEYSEKGISSFFDDSVF